jgi:cold shock CspA family protein/ribosome-associated translation inhibitor RaiA
MDIPLQITFRNMTPSAAIERRITEKAAKLKLFCNRIVSCRVTVEAPHRHHRKGKSYQVRIDLTVPGDELLIRHTAKDLEPLKVASAGELETELHARREPNKRAAHEDLYVAIRDTFNAAGRKLQDYARRRSLANKLHKTSARGRIVKLFPEERYGFLETVDDREVYFHGNSVLEPGYEHLTVGSQVHFTEEEGEKGPQASTVRIAGRRARG